jgi:Leucine-rich repeat (LRR) protein
MEILLIFAIWEKASFSIVVKRFLSNIRVRRLPRHWKEWDWSIRMALSATLKTNNFGTKLCPVSLSQNFGILNMLLLSKSRCFSCCNPSAWTKTSSLLFRFDSFQYKNDIFRYSQNLRQLDLSRNYMPINIRNMFYQLTNLVYLNLHTTSVTTLPVGLFQKMSQLETLIFGGNKIERWNHSVFENVTSLRKLYLDGNNIHVINESSIRTCIQSRPVYQYSGNVSWS